MEGVKISLDELSKLKIPFIVYLWNNHSITVESAETDKLRITDYLNKPNLISKEEFNDMYSGFSLLISKDKIVFPEIKGPAIRFDQYTYNFGEIEQRKNVGFEFNFVNIGKEKLLISEISSDCGCTANTLGKKTFLPGESGTIIGVLSTFDQEGPQNSIIYVHSNDSISPLIPLKIRGFINLGLVIVPEIIRFGETKKGESKIKEIYLINPTKNNVKIKNIKVPFSFISYSISKSENKNRPGYKIKISLSPKAPSGKFEGNITILTDTKKYSEFNIPVVGKVKLGTEI